MNIIFIMKISVVGLGFVGKAMYDVFKDLGCDVIGYDINPKISPNLFQECLNSKIMFLALPTPYNSKECVYEMSPIIDTLKQLDNYSYQGIIVLKSTLTPNSTQNLEKMFPNLILIHNPEFLKAASAKEDFLNQEHIVLGHNSSLNSVKVLSDFYNLNFPYSNISICSTKESESMKIFVNCFYALKIQFFTELYLTSKNCEMDFNLIVDMMIKNNRIHPSDTFVPGPDGNTSYGGYCYPKDTNALNAFMKKNNIPNGVLNACIEERNMMRNDNDNIL